MDSVEIFQEGVRLPPTLVVKGGEPVEGIWSIIEADVRFPRSAIGDMTPSSRWHPSASTD